MRPQTIDLPELLRSSATSWRSARGTFHYWQDIALAELAFGSTRGSNALSRASSGGIAESREETVRFTIDARERNVRAEVVRRVGLPTGPYLIVVEGAITTAHFGTKIVTNKDDDALSIGGAEFVELLQPTLVAKHFTLTVDDRQAAPIAGRPVIAVHATARPADDFGHSLGPQHVFAMTAGGTEFQLAVDAELGVLLRVEKRFNSASAEIAEFTEIEFQRP